MLYFIIGNLMSSFTFLILTKSVSYFSYLLISESFLGWFLIEHIFEEYFLTVNKFFLINYDFRALLKNFCMLIKKIGVTVQPFSLVDISLLNLCVFLIFFFNNKPQFYFKLCLVISFIFYFFISIFPIIICCQYLVSVLFMFIILVYYFKVLYWFFVFLNFKYLIKTLSVKLLFYLLMICVFFVLFSLCFYLSINIQNNIIHENMLIITLPYYYFYIQTLFKLFELKCLLLINYVEIDVY